VAQSLGGGIFYPLDPWWDPAVEAQAIDRAHRIGQRVFAYRLIAREAVAEAVLELQRSKRDFANAIITGNNRYIQNLTCEEPAPVAILERAAPNLHP
jgi:SNF2 family DNA or RNA helicase